ncbi:MAG: hypothetical protein ABIP03_13740, partial [Aquihabitans sp.]
MMNRTEAARVLGVHSAATWDEVRRTYRDRIRTRHPDRAGAAGLPDALRIIEAYRVLAEAHSEPEVHPPESPASSHAGPHRSASWEIPLSVARISNDT